MNRPSARTGLDRTTTALLVCGLVLAFAHHADHVLRVDHSGWPFRDAVTPFTFSLLAYPVILFALLGPVRLFWLRWALLAGAAGFTLYAHTAIESPAMQYGMWAHNESSDMAGVRNAFDVRSPALGALSVAIGMALNLVAVAATVAMFRAGQRTRESNA